MPEDWSREEVEATVSDYFDMLAKELRAQEFNKADHNRNLQKLLDGRTRGSIERKHQNISAVLIELGYPYIDGYKPLSNYQTLLYEVVDDRLRNNAFGLDETVAAAVEETVEKPPVVSDVLGILVPPPHRAEEAPKLYEGSARIRKPVQRNYLEMESRNRELGLAGEKMVLEFEYKRLWQAGRKDLANRIEHVAKSKGDSLGYDILSFDKDAREKLVEVKTTRFGALTPFFASKNEVEVSETKENSYQLYRLFNFVRAPRLFVLPGSIRSTCSLDPVQYSALPR